MKRKKQAGFTLIELVVVMALMTLLVSLASWGILSWRKNSEWLKDEGYAKITFLATKSALSNKEVGNTLDEFIEQVKEEGTCISTLKNLPNDYLGEDIDDRIYYLSAKKGEYLDYCKGKTVSNQAKLIFGLLDSSMEEDSALNGAIVLEIDVKTGQVYSAFVGTWANSFTYQFLRSGERGDISITGDSEHISAKDIRGDVNYRKEHVFGYYTAGGVGEVASLSPKKIKVTSLEIENGETLDLKFSSNSTLQNWDIVYKIDVYSKDLLFSIKLRGIDYQKGYDGIADLEVGDKTYQFPLSYDGTTYTLTLDAMVSSQVMQLHSDFKEIDTFSITRFLKEEDYLDNIYATVQAQPFEVDKNSAVRTDEAYKKFIAEFGAFDYVTEEPKKSEEVCALYSKIDKNIELTTWRHLSNIRYYTKKKSKTTFQLLKNLDWKDVILYELRTEDGSPIRLRKWEKSAQFPTIETDFYKDWIFDGNNKTIQNLELGGLSNISYSDDNKLELKNQATALAIFKNNDGTIQNLYLKNCKVYSELDTTNTVALLCSTNAGTIQEVSIDNQTSMNAIVKESKQSGMGSIVGVNTDSGVVKNCINEGMVEGEGDNIGGFVGYNQGKIIYNQEQKIPSVIGVNNVGGLVGFNDKNGEIELQSKLLINKVIATGNNVGGYIGKNLSSTIFENPIEISCASIKGGKNVGGVIGENSLDVTKAITIQASTDKGAITALDHVGGIIGSQEGSVILKDSTNRMEITATNDAGGILGSVEVKDKDTRISTQSSKKQIEVVPGQDDEVPVEVEYKIEISNVKNYGKISSEAGLIGGIIVKLPEESRILESTNFADLSCVDGTVGGICGINNGGTIQSCEIGTEKINLTGQNIGGLVGTNIGMISECKVGNKIQFSTTDTDNLGGIAAQNQGIVKDSNVEADFKDVQSVTNLGGIVAVNTFEINNSTYTGSILGKDIGTMGGIVGINEGGILECSVELESISINSGIVGAIAGQNNRNIETSTLVAKKEAKIEVQKGLLGGIAGLNNGTITNCGASKSWEFIGNALNMLESDITRVPDFTNDASLDTGSYIFEMEEGILGGIAAENGKEASIKQCITGKNWKLTAPICGGIIGINESGEDNSELVNQAQVSQSGIIGKQETINTSILERCYNLGKVENKEGKAAGILTSEKYEGGMIRNCRNYGEIIGTTDSAGIVIAQSIVQMTGCVNLGTIKSEDKAAGIALNGGNAFVNCYNFGEVSGKSVTGIASSNAYFTQCANFGKLDSNNPVYAITNQEVGDNQCKYTMSLCDKEEIPLTCILTQSSEFNFIVNKKFKDSKEAYEFYVNYILEKENRL